MLMSSTINRELVICLAKVIFLLKHSAKLSRCILCGDVAAHHGKVCVLFAVQTDTYIIIYNYVILLGVLI